MAQRNCTRGNHQMYRLIFLSGPLKGKRLAITQGPVMIGRDPDCHIAVADDEISRKHAIIELRDDGFFIRDLGSMNGILVNDKACRESKLKHGDTLEIGRTKIHFQQMGRDDGREERRVTHSQGLAFGAVFFIVLVQFAFVIGFSLWRKDVVEKPEEAAAATTSQMAVVDTAMSNTFAEASAYLQSVKQSQADEKTPADEPKTNVTEDIRNLRADVEEIRQQVGELAKPAVTSSVQAIAAEEPPIKVDALTAKAQQMLQAALLDLARNNLVQADKQFERIQIMAPNFLSAYIERARLYEQRGELAKAGDQWKEVLHRSSGTPLYEQAAAERIRISRLEIIRKTTEVGTPAEKKPTIERLARRIKIVSVEPQRFPENDQFEEMRLLRITLKPKLGERELDRSEIRVNVLFFDEDAISRDVSPTRVAVPKDALRLDGDWTPNEEQTVTAAYIVPKDFRKTEQEQYGQRCRYYGHLIQVYYREQLQDEDARPKALLQKADQFQPSWHLATQAPATPTTPMTNDENRMTNEFLSP
jgi:hypothetical protein